MKKYIAFLLSGMLFLTACSASFDSGASVQENAAQSQETPLESSVALLASNTVAGETASSLASQNQKTDTVPWRTDLPENHQMDPAVFSQLHTDLESSDVYAMVTVKDGVIIDEFYLDGYDENSVFQLNSCTKSFTGALIGIAIEQGYLGGVDDPLSDYLPQVLDLEDSGKQQITLRHLLFYPQLGVKLCSMAGGGVQKIYMVFLREPSRRDRSGSDLFHLRDGFEIKMNFDRNVSCFIFVNAFMHDDFFD